MIVTQKDFDWTPLGLGGSFNFFECSDKHSSICFLCGEKLTVPCIMWSGCDDISDGELWFHIECAKIFGQKLLAEYQRSWSVGLEPE